MNTKERLNLILEKLELTQADLSRELPFSESGVSAIFNGKEPGPKFLNRLQEKYNVNPAWVKYGQGTKFITEQEKEPSDDLPENAEIEELQKECDRLIKEKDIKAGLRLKNKIDRILSKIAEDEN